MKKLILSVCMVATLVIAFGNQYMEACCKENDRMKTDKHAIAILEGKVHSWTGDGYLLVIAEKGKYDTVQVAADGRFRYELATTVPVETGLYLEYLGDNRMVIACYLTPGGTTRVNITGEKDGERLKSIPAFSGVNQKESEYISKTNGFWCGFQPEYLDKDGKLISFKAYKDQVADYQQTLRDMLKSTRPDFAAEKRLQVDRLAEEVLFPYAWGAKRHQGDASKDADFKAYSDGIDLNNPENLGITDQWLRFYMEKHPDDSFTNNSVRYFNLLREKISSEKVRNKLADERIQGYFALGGDDAMQEIFAAYKQTSTNREAIAEMQPLYDRLSKLIPGVEASDFEMQTVDGRTVRFREVIGKGKAVYIDFWATWCGPCCAEIPYVEKLVEKYKNNPDIEFISISLDNDLGKWHKKLDNDKPSWPQYVVPENFNSAFAKEYNITAIPRFMMFDKEGKIININAPRPSDEQIDAFIQKYLK